MKHYYIEDIQTEAEKAGSHFFDADTKRFFNSRICETTYTDGSLWYFVTSEKYDYKSSRLYTVRSWTPENPRNFDDVSGFQAFKTKAQAVSFIKKISGVLTWKQIKSNEPMKEAQFYSYLETIKTLPDAVYFHKALHAYNQRCNHKKHYTGEQITNHKYVFGYFWDNNK